MIDAAQEIGRRTFLTYVDRPALQKLEQSLGYAARSRRDGAVSSWPARYYRSRYRAWDCVYMDCQQTVYIFV